MARTSYNRKIQKLLQPFNLAYDGAKAKIVTEELFLLLEGVDDITGTKRVELAIKRAERNYAQINPANPAKAESSTTVFRLVRELLKYA